MNEDELKVRAGIISDQLLGKHFNGSEINMVHIHSNLRVEVTGVDKVRRFIIEEDIAKLAAECSLPG